MRRLLDAASGPLGVPVRLFAVDWLPGEFGPTFAALERARPDALIVTGAEPQTLAMVDEALWPALSRLVDWAAANTVSTLWSCMAAHAAVYRLDQIGRNRMIRKLSGVYTCTKGADHPFNAGAPAAWPVPHSRFNRLDEAALDAAGYAILSRLPGIGADSFTKQVGACTFLMLEGHPEYDGDSLLKEYRRDIRRFLSGQQPHYPDLPEHYFTADSVAALGRLRDQALNHASPDLLPVIEAAMTRTPGQAWDAAAVRLYRNWLAHVAAQQGATQLRQLAV